MYVHMYVSMYVCMMYVYMYVSYLYIYIALLAVHTNQKRFQCERPIEKRAVLRERKEALGSPVNKVGRVEVRSWFQSEGPMYVQNEGLAPIVKRQFFLRRLNNRVPTNFMQLNSRTFPGHFQGQFLAIDARDMRTRHAHNYY